MYDISTCPITCPKCHSYFLRRQTPMVATNTIENIYICPGCGFLHTAESDEDMREYANIYIAQEETREDSNKKKEDTMDNKALRIVTEYIDEHLDKSDNKPDYETYIVWKCKILDHWKYLISSTLYDGMYYEVTFNGIKNEWYLDAYKKFENRCIPGTKVNHL